jgi:hypothetical protein
MNFVGLPTADMADPKGQAWWVELMSNPYPQNLYFGFKATKPKRVPA